MPTYQVIDDTDRSPDRRLIGQVLRALPPFVVQLLQDHPRLVLAGGAIRDILTGSTPQDYDLVVAWPAFSYPQDSIGAMLDRGRLGVVQLMETTTFAHTGPDCLVYPDRHTETDRAWTLHWHPAAGKRPPVQILRRTFEHVPACLDAFDYTTTQAALYYHPGNIADAGWYLQLAPTYLEDLLARRLRFVGGGLGSADASAVRGLGMMRRGQGWHLEAEDIGALAVRRLVELDEPAAARALRDGWTATSATAGSSGRPDASEDKDAQDEDETLSILALPDPDAEPDLF